MRIPPGSLLSQVKKALDHADIHVDVPLSDLSTAYMQDQADFIADKVFPVVRVDKKSDKYYTWPKSTFFRARGALWVPGTPMPGGSFSMTTADYSAEFRAFEFAHRWDLKGNADAGASLERAPVEFVSRSLLLNREAEFMSKYMTTGVWGLDLVGGTDFPQWSDFGASDPLEDFRKARLHMRRLSGQRPNTLILGEEVYELLKLHPLIKAIFRHAGGPNIVTVQQLAQALDIPRVLVASATQVTSPEGTAESSATYDFLMGRQAWLGYVAPAPGLMIPSAGYIFAWTGGMMAGYETAIELIPDRRFKVDFHQGYQCYDQKVVGADLGVFFDEAIEEDAE